MVTLRLYFLVFITVTLGSSVRGQESLGGAETLNPPQAAAPGRNLLRPLTLPQWTRVSDEGQIRGSIFQFDVDGLLKSVPRLGIRMVRSGTTIDRDMTNQDGEFVFSGVSPGEYTLVATSQNSVVVFPLQISPPNGTQPPQLQLVAANPVSSDRSQAMLASAYGFPVEDERRNDYLDVRFGREIFDTYDVMISPSGTLVGRLNLLGAELDTVDMSSMRVRILRNGVIIGESPVAVDGRFIVQGTTAGKVAAFAFGRQGFAATGLRLVDRPEFLSFSDGSEEHLVKRQAGPAPFLNIEVAPIRDVMVGMETLPSLVQQPIAPLGISAGGGLGGGAMGAASAGFGGLGALGAAAVGVPSLLDDNNPPIPPAASPSKPSGR